MVAKEGRNFLRRNDMDNHPVWAVNDADDLYYPVCSSEDFPENSMDLCIRAVFQLDNGLNFYGYIVGVENIFCIAIFLEDNVLFLNKNLKMDCIQNINKISDILNKNLNEDDFSHIRYSTQIDLEKFKNIKGDFYLFQERTDIDRLK